MEALTRMITSVSIHFSGYSFHVFRSFEGDGLDSGFPFKRPANSIGRMLFRRVLQKPHRDAGHFHHIADLLAVLSVNQPGR